MIQNILWLVTARAGSKGLRNKNILPLGGVPLLAWRILAARQLGGTIWLSTDSEEYAAIGRQYGADTPFLRPAELATDEASSADVVLHAKRYAEGHGFSFEALGHLQPTSPFAQASTLQRGVNLLAAHPDAHSVVAVSRAPVPSPFIQPVAQNLDVLCNNLAKYVDTRRQALPEEITPCGGLYLTRWQWLEERPYYQKSLPLLLDGAEALDIDEQIDFDFANHLIISKHIGEYDMCRP